MPESVQPRRLSRPTVQLLAAVLSFALTLLSGPLAHAEEVFTGQAAAANATDSTWIPAPAQRAALCIIDTGNDITPDTANVVARFAYDGSPDTAGDLNKGKHGTLMSMIASAPYDRFGMVGAAPSINVVSVRASREGASFGSLDLKSAIQLCVDKRWTYNIKVVSMSLGGALDANASQKAQIETTIDYARSRGLNVVAAAGNSSVGTVDWPAGYNPTLAVGAADNSGERCSFASWGPQVDLWASGCPLDVGMPNSTGAAAWANGSSEATAFVAGVLTQLRGLDPSLGIDAAEQLLTGNTSAKGAGPFLNVAAAFAADDLGAQLAAGQSATPGTHTTPPTPTTTPATTTVLQTPDPDPGSSPASDPGLFVQHPPGFAPTTRTRLAKPIVRSWSLRRGVLTIVFKAKPKKTDARVQVYARKKERAFPTLTRNLRVTGDRLRTRVSGTLSQVSITYRDPTGARGASASLSLHPRK